MKKTRISCVLFPAVLGLTLAGDRALAAVTFLNSYTGTVSELSSATELAYQANVSASDLLTGLTATTTGWNFTNGSHPSEMTDGIHGLSFAAAGNNVAGTWTTVGATADYNLGTGANGLGYDITSIQTIAAWVNAGFGNQAWTVAVRPVGGSFTTLATANLQPFTNTAGGASMITLGGLNATGIDAIRFIADSASGGNSGAFVFRELDVFGSSTVPEPTSCISLLLGSCLLLRRNRNR